MKTINRAKCRLALDGIQLSPEGIADTLAAMLNDQDDIRQLQGLKVRLILDKMRKGLV